MAPKKKKRRQKPKNASSKYTTGTSHRKSGKIRSFFLHNHNKSTWDLLDNKTAFINLALEFAPDFLAWSTLAKEYPDKYKRPDVDVEKVIGEFNRNVPLDRLTQSRRDKEALSDYESGIESII